MVFYNDSKVPENLREDTQEDLSNWQSQKECKGESNTSQKH